MNSNKLKKLLQNFDENQLAEINSFLNSADGRRLKNNISDADKESLLRQFENIDMDKAKKAFSKISKDDIIQMLSKRK